MRLDPVILEHARSRQSRRADSVLAQDMQELHSLETSVFTATGDASPAWGRLTSDVRVKEPR